MSKSDAMLMVALVGQPNVGKSTVFNMLTGLNQHVGNWPGKTVEQKTGVFNFSGQPIRLVDLPGTYSLTANSEEERITRNYLLHEKPDVVIVIVNAATLERNLYLVAELLCMPVPVIVGLNMLDVAERTGIRVEAHVLQAALGLPVVPLIASRNQGIRELMAAAVFLAENPQGYTPSRPEMRAEHRPVLAEIRNLLGEKIPLYPPKWVATKLLEGDVEITNLVRQSAPEVWEQISELLLQHEGAYLDVAGGRYEWIERMVRAAMVKPKTGVIRVTDRLDKVATHPFWGLVLLLGIFGVVFWLTYAVAMPLVTWLDTQVITAISAGVRQALVFTPEWFSSLLVDGLIAGAGAVLTLLPVLIIFFAVLGLLEDVGYLARSAYVMDRFMHHMGLHGRSFLPMFIGFGCNVPGILGTRIIEDRRSRLLTILLLPLIPCTGRMAVIVFFAAAFFGQNAALVNWALVAGNLLLLFTLGILLNRILFKGVRSAFIMEMPLYHLPNMRTIGLYIWNNTRTFVMNAGTIILLASAAVWLFAYLPNGEIESSLLARFGHWLEPAGQRLGFGDWRLIIALLSSFIAKENTIATMGVLYGSESGMGLAEQVAQTMIPAAGLAFLVVQMTFIPCVATVAAMKQETGTWKWPVFSAGLLLVLSFGAAALIYQFAHWLGQGL
jgi:ferrous iron transport protein B